MDPVDSLKAIHFRHLNIQKDKVLIVALKMVYKLTTRFQTCDCHALFFKDRFGHHKVCSVVVYNNDPVRHIFGAAAGSGIIINGRNMVIFILQFH